MPHPYFAVERFETESQMKRKTIFMAADNAKFYSQTVKAVLLLLLVSFRIQTFGQAAYSLDVDPKLKVSGTSTIHDWEMTSNKASGVAHIVVDNSTLKDISFLEVKVPARSLKSGKGAMDSNACKALNTNQYPEITFELVETQRIIGQKVVVKGKLTVSGVSRVAVLNVDYKISGDDIHFSGEHAIKFSEFNIDPPTAVFGTIKTGDDLKLSFHVTFKSTTKISKQ